MQNIEMKKSKLHFTRQMTYWACLSQLCGLLCSVSSFGMPSAAPFRTFSLGGLSLAAIYRAGLHPQADELNEYLIRDLELLTRLEQSTAENWVGILSNIEALSFPKVIEARLLLHPEKHPVLGRKFLEIALKKRDLPMMRFLISLGIDASSVLNRAVEQNEMAIAKFLLQNGANPNWFEAPPTGRAMTPWMKAVENGNQEMADLLHAFGADHEVEGKRQVLVEQLLAATVRGDIQGIEALLNIPLMNLTVEQVDQDGNSLVMLASRRGRLPLVKALVQKGANLYRLNHRRENALDQANRSFNIALVNFLYAGGLNPSAQVQFNEGAW